MADREGQRLDNYRLTRLLGAGSFGQVYLAEHVYRETHVAVKVLPPLSDDDLPDFLNEARTIRLRHPHIVPILDFGVDNHVPFIVMEYIANGTLRQRYPKGSQLQLDLIVLYIKQVADALQYAHDEKLIHRDVKPENMLLRSDNDVLLSDFGIATIARSSGSRSILEMAGTITYMAPEQLHGRPVLASDQYSLGVVVYEWLCGERPFKGSPMEIATQHMLKPIPSLRGKVPNLPPPVEQVVLKALEKEPQKRFSSVQAFANALEQASRPEPTRFVTPPSFVQPPTPAPLKTYPVVDPSSKMVPIPSELPVPNTSLPITPAPAFVKPLSNSSPSSYIPARSSSQSIIKEQDIRKRRRMFYPTLAFIALLVITLAGGGVFYFSRVNDSQAVNQILDTTQQQINNTHSHDPASALKTLSTAQKSLGDVQSNHQLDGAQMQRVTALQDQLVRQVNAAIGTYNTTANITVLPCPSKPVNNSSIQTHPQSIVYGQNAKSEAFLYSLAQDKNVYEINHQNNQYSMVSSLLQGKPTNFLSMASNGSFLVLVGKQVNTYSLSVFQPGQQGVVSAIGVPTAIGAPLTDGGYVPALITAWGTNVYVVLASPSEQGNPRILSYILDAKGHLSTPKETQISISAPIVSIAAFPDQLFLLLSSGEVQSIPLVSGSQSSPPPAPVVVQSPIALPLTTNANSFNINDPVPTVPSNNLPGSAPLSVPSALPASTAVLTVGLVGHTPHLYIGDPVNQRVLDLKADSGAQGSPTGTNGAASSVTLQLVQQYVSSTDLSQVKSLATDPQGTKLTVLSQTSLVSISTGTQTLNCV